MIPADARLFAKPSRRDGFASCPRFVAAGGKELVLSGINLGRWRHDLDKASDPRLPALVRRIFDETALSRLRLSSIEPMDWDPGLIGLLRTFGASGRLARHAHLPLQSG